jgi:hypothetical protein
MEPFYVSRRHLKALLVGPDPDDAALFVAWYLKQGFLRDDDEPISEVARLEVILARVLCGRRGGAMSITKGRNSKERMLNQIEAAAARLQVLNPISTVDFWRRVIAGIMLARPYAGNTLRPKKRPALPAQMDAPRMTAKQLMEKHRISRSRAYQLLKKARSQK